jgi:hypothetical protein
MADRRILVCNIGWMARYEGLRNKPDKIVGGGDWVKKHRKGGEVCNFLKCADGYVYGHVETIKGDIDRKIRIDALGASPTAKFIDRVTVFWTATDPDSGGRYVVGWYPNARVFRERQHFNTSPSSQHQKDGLRSFVVRAKGRDGVRIPIEQRNVRLKSGKGWMGHAQWWFPHEHVRSTPDVKVFLRELSALLEGEPDDVAQISEIKSAKTLSATQRKAGLGRRRCCGPAIPNRLQAKCPRARRCAASARANTIIALAPATFVEYSRLPIISVFTILPATRAQNTSPIRWSKTSSGVTRESMQPTMAAKGD